METLLRMARAVAAGAQWWRIQDNSALQISSLFKKTLRKTVEDEIRKRVFILTLSTVKRKKCNFNSYPIVFLIETLV